MRCCYLNELSGDDDRVCALAPWRRFGIVNGRDVGAEPEKNSRKARRREFRRTSQYHIA